MSDNNNIIKRKHPDDRICLLYLFVCSMGLVGLTNYLSLLISSSFFPGPAITVNDYLSSYFFRPEKRFELLHYVLSIVLLVVYYLLGYYILYRRKAKKLIIESFDNNKFFIVYVIIALSSNVFLLNPHNTDHIWKFIAGAVIWIIIILFPFFERSYAALQSKSNGLRYLNLDTIYYLLFILIILQFIHIFWPFVAGKLKMINEFLNVPEYTLLETTRSQGLNPHSRISGNSRKELTYVDNVQFINKHKLFGNYFKYDMENDVDRDPVAPKDTYIYLPHNKDLQKFLDRRKLKKDLKYYFNNRVQGLAVIDRMTIDDKNELFKIAKDDSVKLFINDIYTFNQENNKKLKSRKYSDEEKAFLKKNKFELYCQILNRWVIHHHNFILGPINEYSLGKNIKDIYMQYGWLNVVALAKLLERLGGITYQGYFKVWFSFYYLYYGLFLLLLFLLLEKINYVLLVAILSFATINQNGFNFLFLAPGFNPVRHFFDIFVIGFLFLYAQNNKKYYLYLSLLMAIAGILNNTQTGFFSLVALIVVLLILYRGDRQANLYRDVLPIAASGCLGLYLFLWNGIGREGLSKYYLKGLLGYYFSPSKMNFIIICFSVVYAFIPKIIKINNPLKYVALLLFFYSQMLLFYYVWGSTDYQFLNYAPIYALAVIVLLKLLIDNVDFLKRNTNFIIASLIFVSFTAYIQSVNKYYEEKKDYDRIFNDHKTYEWNFDNAQFLSTMDPKYFINGANLIKEYSEDKGIYILSKYDNILPFLAKRYSAMPYFEVSNFLVTQSEIQECVDVIIKNKPTYLFVDTDIERNLNTDIINKAVPELSYLHDESVWRVQRLNLLKDLFNAVHGDYRLIERGYLISVYKRNESGIYNALQVRK